MQCLGVELNRRLEQFHKEESEEKKNNSKALKMEIIDKLEEIEVLDRLHSFRIYRNLLFVPNNASTCLINFFDNRERITRL